MNERWITDDQALRELAILLPPPQPNGRRHPVAKHFSWKQFRATHQLGDWLPPLEVAAIVRRLEACDFYHRQKVALVANTSRGWALVQWDDHGSYAGRKVKVRRVTTP